MLSQYTLRIAGKRGAPTADRDKPRRQFRPESVTATASRGLLTATIGERCIARQLARANPEAA